MLFLLIFVICLVLQLFLPWWIIAPIVFCLAFWKARSAKKAFAVGFNAIFILWLIMGLVKTLPNENILANRVGQMLQLPDLSFNWMIVLLITGLVGGLASGLSALAGYYFKEALNQPR
ncbi:MAG: hypothetical protein JWN56_1363 [Sphingobacteriales bacterium]|nr:hypothetical protein [Sphingobacteriales bacterium]